MNPQASGRSLRLAVMLSLLVTLFFASIAPVAQAVERDDPQISSAIDWLRDQQAADGSFAAFGGEGDPGTTADVVLALVAAGIDPQTMESDTGADPLTYLQENAGALADDPGLAAKVALALHAAGNDPRDAGTDLITLVTDGLNPETGFYGMGAYSHAYALLALAAVGDVPPAEADDALLNAQIDDGSWSFTGESIPGTGDSNTTALAIQALVALDTGQEAVEAGLDYLRSLQDDAGAIAYDASAAPDLAGDANSTAVAAQAFVAAGEDASNLTTTLGTFQNTSGAFIWQAAVPDDSLLATAQAIPALLEQPLPFNSDTPDTGPQQAGVVVRMEDGTLRYAAVEFEEASIDGIELLSRSGLDVTVAPFGGLGGAVCSIEGTGCPSDDCFCESYSNPPYFWHYYVYEGGEWTEYPAGPSSRSISHGAIDGWSWTADEPGLPETSLEDIAASSTATDDTDNDSSNQPAYLAFAGMLVLVLVIGGYTVVRRKRTAT